MICAAPGPGARLSPGDPKVFDGLDRRIETDEDAAEVEVDFCARWSEAAAPSTSGTTARWRRPTRPGNQPQPRDAIRASSRVDDLGRIGVPTLVVHGTEDPIYLYDHATTLVSGIPYSTLVTWEGVGHERPPPLIPELTRHNRNTPQRSD